MARPSLEFTLQAQEPAMHQLLESNGSAMDSSHFPLAAFSLVTLSFNGKGDKTGKYPFFYIPSSNSFHE